jgi:hypothetical protein
MSSARQLINVEINLVEPSKDKKYTCVDFDYRTVWTSSVQQLVNVEITTNYNLKKCANLTVVLPDVELCR